MVACLLLAPPAYLVLYWLELFSGQEPEVHPLTRIIGPQLLWFEPALMVLGAMIVAPVKEEVLFRGLLQPWLAHTQTRGRVAVIIGVGLALYQRSGQLESSWQAADWRGLGSGLVPAAFVLAMAPGFWLLGRLQRPQAAQAVLGSSLLFAAAHSAVWPTPIPLMVLALGLGWLAWRTQSLVGPIVCHALFNGVACVQMFWK
jgi:membrane protease YdiL (CAAX protease family)